jgi:hypothetical protein
VITSNPRNQTHNPHKSGIPLQNKNPWLRPVSIQPAAKSIISYKAGSDYDDIQHDDEHQ